MDLRFTMLAVPPVLTQIHRDLGLDEKSVGALTSVPVLLLSVAAIGGSLLIARLGARRATIVGLSIIAVAGALRGVGPSTALLFAMTFFMGMGVAICQPAAPTLVGEWFPARIGLATAVYVNGILVGEAIPADLVPVILPHIGNSWELNLALWSIPVILTALVFGMWVSDVDVDADADAAPHGDEPRSVAWWPDWHKFLTWRLGILQAGISVLYFGLNAYIPDYFHALGRPWLSPIAIGALNTAQVPGSIATMFFAQKLAGKPRFFFLILLVALPAVAMLIAGSDAMVVVGVLALGTLVGRLPDDDRRAAPDADAPRRRPPSLGRHVHNRVSRVVRTDAAGRCALGRDPYPRYGFRAGRDRGRAGRLRGRDPAQVAVRPPGACPEAGLTMSISV